jgi:hypothetical protein
VIKSARGFLFLFLLLSKEASVLLTPQIYIYIYIYTYPCHCMDGFNMQQNLTILSSLWSSSISLFPQFFWPSFGSFEGTKNGCLESQGWDHLMSCC